MNNRFRGMGKTFLGAICLLSICGASNSCSDDYDLDETMPSFLGGSIYDELKSGKYGQFNTVIKLIDDLNYTEVLSKTGSKTLFVADDSAYNRFFQTTTWKDGNGNPIREYSQLSAAQKRILLYGSMLNNADVLEMLPYSTGGGRLTMRRSTALTAVDSVKSWAWNELPNNMNLGGDESKDKRFWDRYRTQAHGNLLMATDATSPMLVHFIEEQMKEKNITRGDISFILGLTGTNDDWKDNTGSDNAQAGKRTYIYDAQVIKQDITCMNGYFNILNKVLVTPQNMAEVIRENPNTQVFSALLDRFSAPYYNSNLTEQYRALYDIGNDSVFEKKYISSRSSSGDITQDPDENSLGDFPKLSYDPGWNEYATSSNIPKEQDMAAMFVPNDEAMLEYFKNGGGRIIAERYGLVSPDQLTKDNLAENLSQIPLDIVQSLINNLMKDSFLESVPSKYNRISNDAQDAMFPSDQYPSVADYEKAFDECHVANNGVVYVMNRVIAPADYSSVIAPALFSNNTQVVRSVIRADDNFIESTPSASPLGKYYSVYLKAMQSRFSLFVPVDAGLKAYGLVDPMTMALANNTTNSYWNFEYRSTEQTGLPVRAIQYRLNVPTGPRVNEETGAPSDSRISSTDPTGGISYEGETVSASVSGPSGEAGYVKRNLLIDMMDQHIVVHDSENGGEDGMTEGRKYFISRNGAPVILVKKSNAANQVGMEVEGGYQWQVLNDQYPNNDYVSTVTEGHDMRAIEANGNYGNGMTYFIDRAMQPTTRSVYDMLRSESDFSQFSSLCQEAVDEGLLEEVGFLDGVSDENKRRNIVKLYSIFNTTYDTDRHASNNGKLVRFFNNYRYTIYVPDNTAMQSAFNNGLKTVAQIKEWVNANKEDGKLPDEKKAQAQAMITALVNFMKYHFQDNSVYVDNVTKGATKYQTSCTDSLPGEKLNYITITVNQTPNHLTLTDRNGQTVNVTDTRNLLARDANFNRAATAGLGKRPTAINESSFVVLHKIDGSKYLTFFDKSQGSSFSDLWSTAAKAKAFVAKYRIRN